MNDKEIKQDDKSNDLHIELTDKDNKKISLTVEQFKDRVTEAIINIFKR
jgi:hypothetical protein